MKKILFSTSVCLMLSSVSFAETITSNIPTTRGMMISKGPIGEVKRPVFVKPMDQLNNIIAKQRTRHQKKVKK